jgi:hypothetical protein
MWENAKGVWPCFVIQHLPEGRLEGAFEGMARKLRIEY